ncbi:phosphoribosyltransferase [Paraglaciecola sp. T6c]|uniref:phosphoribosyltransferase n=1 Tax=Pseudoalteromonas atlantica (strain T6c / ATCC BAA-1087) TaxID=3042615 RepID=UPI0002E9E364|nr:phosphoribosyltransferase family protein [Paraglaciecola sp. T6c]
MEKTFISEDALIQDAFRLGVEIFNSNYRPDFVVGIWRGGSTVGIYVQECLQYLGVETDHISIRTSYQGQPGYQQMIDSEQGIKVHGLQYLLENLNQDDKLLIVDDVYSSGLSIKAVLDQLSSRAKRNMPKDFKVAVPWFKPANNRTDRVPDYFINTSDKWLILPYEMVGLTHQEIIDNKPGLKAVMDSIVPTP